MTGVNTVSIKRRTFLKGSVATSALGFAVSAGLLKPSTVMAAWPDSGFKAKNVGDALSALFGSSDAKSGDVNVKAPDIAENGAVVPVSVSSKVQNVKGIAILVEKNPQPLACSFDMNGNLEAFVSTRIKMGETSDVVAVVKTGDGSLISAKKAVKVTIGGCGG
jgi:sulfur-oxidizing protein SoxY